MILISLALPAIAAETVLLPAGSTWSYLDTGVDPGPTWIEPTFDDSGWLTGPAPLGYGILVSTTVDYGVDVANRHITTWFRTTVNIADPADFDAVSLHLQRDDGAVVWINGIEAVRSNLSTPSTSDTLATDSVFGLDQDALLPFVVPDGVLVAGDNTVAVEVHQQSPSSFDLVMDLAMSGWDGPTTVTRGPYLQLGTDEGVTVRWSTDGPSLGRLWWGRDPGLHEQWDTDPVVGFEHELAVTGMPANAVAYYAVGTPSGLVLAGDDPDHAFRTAPIAGTRQPIRVWALGDSGTADANAEAVRDAYGVTYPDPLDTDVWLMLGDNAYNSGTEPEYQTAVFDFYPEYLRQLPLWPAIGNHDGFSAFSATQTGPYFELFTLPSQGEAGGVPSGTEAFWSFDYGNVHFVNLDSYHSDRSPTGAMLTWLAADLAATTADWVIAFWHHPPYSKGSHNSDTELGMVEMRENALPILEAGGVDLALPGHSHSYERSMLLDGHYGLSTTLTPDEIRQDHGGDPTLDGAYTKWAPGIEANQGAVYIVAGSSGKISGGALDHPAMFTSLNFLGSVVIDIDGLELEASFLDDVGLVQDRFAIRKGVTTIVQMSAPTAVLPGGTADLSGLALQSDGTEPPSYEWDPGDGSAPIPAADISHTYAGPEGTVVATLTVVDDGGIEVSDTIDIHIDAGPPVIVSTSPSLTDEGALTSFSFTATDPAGDAVTAVWTIEGFDYPGDTTDFTFWDNGTYPIGLAVTDDAGQTTSTAFDLQVNNLPPYVVSLTTSNLVQGVPGTLSVVVDDPGLFDLVDTIEWDLNDGIPRFGSEVTGTFNEAGIVPIGLTLTDDEGAVAILVEEVTVGNALPSIDSITWDGQGHEGVPVGFSATASDGTDPGPITLTWDFGDGTLPMVGSPITHTFPDQGPWTITLAATDAELGTALATLDVVLENLPPTIDSVAMPSGGDEGSPLVWTALSSDPGSADVLTHTWQLGDGTVAEGAGVVHAYANDGVYLVQLTVTDDEGAGQNLLAQVQIRNVPPRFLGTPSPLVTPPSQEWRWAANIDEPGDDPLSFVLQGPPGASVDAAGLVRWVPSPADNNTAVPFALTVSDGVAGETLAWSVLVTDAPPGGIAKDQETPSGCDCQTGGPRATGLLGAALLISMLRRRRTG